MRFWTIGRLALATVAATAVAAPSAGALTPPLPDPGEHALWLTPPGAQQEVQLRGAGGCTAPPRSICIQPALPDDVQLITAATPGTAAIRSLRPLSALTVTPGEGAPPAAVTRVDDTHWTVDLPALSGVTFVSFVTTVADGSGGTWSHFGHLAPPRGEATLLRAARRGRAVVASVRLSVPGELKAYVTVRGRRRSGVVTQAVEAAGDHAVRIPLSVATLRALPRGAGVTAVFRPADGQPTVRAGHSWQPAAAR